MLFDDEKSGNKVIYQCWRSYFEATGYSLLEEGTCLASTSYSEAISHEETSTVK